MPAPPHGHDAYAALRDSNYRRFALGHLLSSTALQMFATTVSWELYARTGSAMALGYIGLARVIPVLILALPAGHAADTLDRRRVLTSTQAGFALLITLAAWLSYVTAPIWVYYFVIMGMGCARAFNGSSRNALLPLIVPPEAFTNAVTWNSGVFHASAVAGPLFAGLAYWWTGLAWPVYALCALGCAAFALATATLTPVTAQARSGAAMSLRAMGAGLGHLRRERTVLAAITLDLFAVLFGGATAMLPVFAKDILGVGEVGHGMLRAAPFAGALVMSFVLAHRAPIRRNGRALLWAVGCFGAATIAFGLSTNFVLSLTALLLAGAADNISVVIRHVLVQVRTPDELRGRVGAVNTLFIESSNELGAFESGVVAALTTPMISVVSGGGATVLVVACVAARWPELRRLGSLHPQEKPRHAKAG
ncbi:MAG: MFS transporter [Phycisphaerae bacterium]|nr:MFS transporter [Phycisphaerae bacterium]